MILVDTSIWVDHLNDGDPAMAALLEAGDVLMHPHIIGEISLGSLRDRAGLIGRLRMLPEAAVASDAEVVTLIEDRALFGTGIGCIDAHLLAAAMLTPSNAPPSVSSSWSRIHAAASHSTCSQRASSGWSREGRRRP